MPIPHHVDPKLLAMHVACLTFAQEIAADYQVPSDEIAKLSLNILPPTMKPEWTFSLNLPPYRSTLMVQAQELFDHPHEYDFIRRVTRALFEDIVYKIQKDDQDADDNLVVTHKEQPVVTVDTDFFFHR